MEGDNDIAVFRYLGRGIGKPAIGGMKRACPGLVIQRDCAVVFCAFVRTARGYASEGQPDNGCSSRANKLPTPNTGSDLMPIIEKLENAGKFAWSEEGSLRGQVCFAPMREGKCNIVLLIKLTLYGTLSAVGFVEGTNECAADIKRQTAGNQSTFVISVCHKPGEGCQCRRCERLCGMIGSGEADSWEQ